MAEAALGVVASGISIISLAIQLGDSIMKAIEFCESYRDGPEDINRLTEELHVLANIIRILQQEENGRDVNPVSKQLMERSLMLAKADIDKLAKVITGMSRRTRPSTGPLQLRWGRFRIATIKGTISQLRGYVNNAVAVLSLLEITRTRLTQLQLKGRIETIADSIESINETMRSKERTSTIHNPDQLEQLQMPDNNILGTTGDETPRKGNYGTITSLKSAFSISWNIFSGAVGILSWRTVSVPPKTAQTSVQTETAILANHKRKTRKHVINLLLGLTSCRKGYRFEMNDTFDRWCFNSIRTVENKSQIFKFCRDGDIQGIRELLTLGMASLFDVDNCGWSPLHHACASGRQDVCRFLLEHGADSYLMDIDGNLPLDTMNYVLEIVLPEFKHDDQKDHSVYFANACYSDDSPRLVPRIPLPRDDVSQTIQTLIHYGEFDPFDVPQRVQRYRGEGQMLHHHLPLWSPGTAFTITAGLPLQNLKYVLRDDQAGLEYRCCFIYLNFRSIETGSCEAKQSLEFLCIEYENIRAKLDEFDFCYIFCPLLHTVIAQWAKGIHPRAGSRRKYHTHVVSALQHTLDLHREDKNGRTVLDVLAEAGGEEFIKSWINMLHENKIDIWSYGLTESNLRPGGWVRQAKGCCRNLRLEFKFDEDKKDLCISVESRIYPPFLSLDLSYLCPSSWQRRRKCLSMQDHTKIRDGKPLSGMPGSWDEEELVPNSSLAWEEFYHYGRTRFRYGIVPSRPISIPTLAALKGYIYEVLEEEESLFELQKRRFNVRSLEVIANSTQLKELTTKVNSMHKIITNDSSMEEIQEKITELRELDNAFEIAKSIGNRYANHPPGYRDELDDLAKTYRAVGFQKELQSLFKDGLDLERMKIILDSEESEYIKGIEQYRHFYAQITRLMREDSQGTG